MWIDSAAVPDEAIGTVQLPEHGEFVCRAGVLQEGFVEWCTEKIPGAGCSRNVVLTGGVRDSTRTYLFIQQFSTRM
jgi:hypothetical protein